MKIAVTGAGGFLGMAILKNLSDSVVEVIAISSQAEQLQREFAKVKHISISDSLSDIPENTDVLLNCAFPRNADGEGMAQGLQYIQKVFSTASKRRVHALINISSQSVYDTERISAADEETPLKLQSSYAVGKYASELLADSICHDIPHTNIRMASLIGPGLEQRVVNKMVQQAIEGKKIYVRIGRQILGYMDVRDAASALVTASSFAGRGEKLETVYNLGSERDYTLMEIANKIAETAKALLGTTIEIICEESRDMINSSMVSEKFYRAFDWRPGITMDETIRFLLLKKLGGVMPYNKGCPEKKEAA